MQSDFKHNSIENSEEVQQDRRQFLYFTTAGVGVVGVGLAAWPVVHQMNPDKSVLSMATTTVDITAIQEGQRVTVVWRGKPIFISHRTDAEIESAQQVSLSELVDPQADSVRTPLDKKWLVMIGSCTHLGCIPQGQKEGSEKGEFGGWLCPCHYSIYDTAGRIRKGPAPKNLELPPYSFNEDKTKIIIG